MSDLKEYIVTLHRHEDLDDFYQDMESPRGDVFIPNRAVSVEKRRPISRNTHYWLTHEEAELIKQDPRVWDVTLSPRELGIKFVPLWSRTGDFAKVSFALSNDKNWGVYRTILGNKIGGWGSNGVQRQTATINFPLSGKNVDVVIVDGLVKSNHAEFKTNVDGTGDSRFVPYNWFSLDPPGFQYPNSGSYYYNAGDSADRNHGTHVAGITLGNTQGFAIDANLYNIGPYGENGVGISEFYDYIRAWHNNKAINPNTGYKNPTVTTNSYGILAYLTLNEMNTIPVTITYRGTVYSGPWTLTGNSTRTYQQLGSRGFGQWRIAYGDTRMLIEAGYATELTPFAADLESALADGIHLVFASGNENRVLDKPGGLDYDNSFNGGYFTYYTNRSSLVQLGGLREYIWNVGNIGSRIDEPTATSSCRGPAVNIWAPGSSIVSSLFDYGSQDFRGLNNDTIGSLGGTSMACPQVGGVIALILELHPTITPAELFNYLRGVAKQGLIDESLSITNTYGDGYALLGSENLSLFVPSPTFAISPNTTEINLGETVTYSITTTNVPNGSKVYLKEIGNTINGAFDDNTNQFTITINNNQGQLSRTVNLGYNNSSNSILELRTGGFNGNVQVTAAQVNLNSSGEPFQSFNIIQTSPGAGTVNEGSNITFDVLTTNVINGTELYWTINNITTDNNDFNSTTGTVVINSNSGSFSILTIADQSTEGVQSFSVKIRTNSINGPEVTGTTSISIIDTSIGQTYFLSTDVASPVNEGTVINFTLQTTNISTGTSIPWEIIGIGETPTDEFDFLTASSGQFVLDAIGQAIVTISIKNDLLNENANEQFRFRLTNNIDTYKDFTVLDTSVSEYQYNLTYSPAPPGEGQTIVLNISVGGNFPNRALIWKNVGTAEDDLVEGNTGFTPIVSGPNTTFSLRLKSDILDENENLIITLEDPTNIGVILTSTTISIIENSPFVSVGVPKVIINEGETITFSLQTTNIANNTVLKWQNIGNTDVTDFFDNKNQGTVVVNNNSSTLQIKLLEDKKLEGDEYIIIKFTTTADQFLRLARTIEVIDTSIPTEQAVIDLTEIKDLTTIFENNISIFKTEQNLGTIKVNEASEFQLETLTTQPFNFYYSIKEGSLPPGLTLQSDGSITGNPTYNSNLINTFTNYVFTVTISKIVGDPISTSTFLLTRISNTSTEFTELYIKPTQSISQRKIVKEFLNNKNIFKKEYIYRPFDRNFGVSKELKAVIHYGIELGRILEDYNINIYKRKFSLANPTTAVAKDYKGNVIYEVVYSPLVDYNVNKQTKKSIPRNIKEFFINIGLNWFPNTVINMREELEIRFKHTADFNPKFMKTIQEDSLQELGYIPCVIYCYTKPGKSKFILELIKKYKINFNEFDFDIDKIYLRNFFGTDHYINRVDYIPTHS